MHRQLIRFITLYQILGFLLRGMDRAALEGRFRSMLFFDRPLDPSRLRIPFNGVSCFEFLWH